MGATAFNRARRLAAAKAAAARQSGPATTSTTATSAASAQPSPTAAKAASVESSASDLLPALKIANSADSPDDLTPIPTVGKGAGRVILKQRPDDGYKTVADLPQKIFEAPFNCDADQIAAWEG